jgi:molecular chaperone DnaK (HSP70)
MRPAGTTLKKTVSAVMLIKRMICIDFSAPSQMEVCRDLLLLDVIPLGLGIEDANGQMCMIIPRNCTIPTKSNNYSVFTNAYAYQTTAIIRVFHGEHKLTKYNVSTVFAVDKTVITSFFYQIFLGEFALKGLTPNFASQTLQISIVIDVDANGLIRVNAEEPRSGAKATFEVDRNDGKCFKTLTLIDFSFVYICYSLA